MERQKSRWRTDTHTNSHATTTTISSQFHTTKSKLVPPTIKITSQKRSSGEVPSVPTTQRGLLQRTSQRSQKSSRTRHSSMPHLSHTQTHVTTYLLILWQGGFLRGMLLHTHHWNDWQMHRMRQLILLSSLQLS